MLQGFSIVDFQALQQNPLFQSEDLVTGSGLNAKSLVHQAQLPLLQAHKAHVSTVPELF